MTLRTTVAAQEKLRRLHNLKGEAFRVGTLPAAEWLNWRRDIFEPLNREIGKRLAELRKTKPDFDRGKTRAGLAMVEIERVQLEEYHERLDIDSGEVVPPRRP